MRYLTAVALTAAPLPAFAHISDAPHLHPEQGAAWLIGVAVIALAGTAAVVRAKVRRK